MRPRVGSHAAPPLLKRDSGGALRIFRPYRTNWAPRHQGPDLLPERDGRQKDNCNGQSHNPKQDGSADQRSFNQNGFHIL